MRARAALVGVPVCALACALAADPAAGAFHVMISFPEPGGTCLDGAPISGGTAGFARLDLGAVGSRYDPAAEPG